VVAEATRGDGTPERVAPKKFFQRLGEAGPPVADHNGALWMEVSDGDESSRVGLSASNIFSADSNPEVAYELVLARIDRVLKSPKHSRENMTEFKKDWEMLQYAPSYTASTEPNPATPAGPRGEVLATRK
jgi:hypothetical protein